MDFEIPVTSDKSRNIVYKMKAVITDFMKLFRNQMN